MCYIRMEFIAMRWWFKVVKIKWNNFSLLSHNFIVLYELLMPCQLFARKCWHFVDKMLTKYQRVRGPLPLVMYIRTFCFWVLLHYNMSFKTSAGGFNWLCFLMVWCTFWRLRKNLPKLSYHGFNITIYYFHAKWISFIHVIQCIVQ